MTHIVAKERVEVGDNVLIASKCFISDTSHGAYKGENQDNPQISPNRRNLVTEPVKIGNNVWIGENVVILPGTAIGDGCIIGANSVLPGKEYLQNSIVAGIPAQIIKKYNIADNSWHQNKT